MFIFLRETRRQRSFYGIFTLLLIKLVKLGLNWQTSLMKQLCAYLVNFPFSSVNFLVYFIIFLQLLRTFSKILR